MAACDSFSLSGPSQTQTQLREQTTTEPHVEAHHAKSSANSKPEPHERDDSRWLKNPNHNFDMKTLNEMKTSSSSSNLDQHGNVHEPTGSSVLEQSMQFLFPNSTRRHCDAEYKANPNRVSDDNSSERLM